MKPVILCVDDTPSVLAGEKMLLEQNGHPVPTATNDNEAVQDFMSHSVDLVSLDSYLPHDSIQVFPRLLEAAGNTCMHKGYLATGCWRQRLT